jgi:hypothetical protein
MLTLKTTAARTTAITLVIIAMVFTLAVYLQIQVLQLSLNWDSLWLLHCASAILQGKQYYYDFMETNPPLIMFFYMPALGVGALLGVTDYLGLLIYLFVLIGIVLYIAYRLLHRIMPSRPVLVSLLLVAMAIILIIVPFFWFGEREHCAVILVIPYLLSTIARLSGVKINRYEGVLYGLFAGIGFLIKPYFIMPLILVEAYYLIKKRKLRHYWRTEIIVIGMISIIYACIIIFYFPAYYQKLIPFLGPLYLPLNNHIGFVTMWGYRFTLLSIFSLALISYYLLMRRDGGGSKVFFSVFSLAAIGFLVAYGLGERPWFYHVYPAMVLTLIPLIWILWDIYHTLTAAQRGAVTIFIIGLLGTLYLYQNSMLYLPAWIGVGTAFMISLLYGLIAKRLKLALLLFVFATTSLLFMNFASAGFIFSYPILSQLLIPVTISLLSWLFCAKIARLAPLRTAMPPVYKLIVVVFCAAFIAVQLCYAQFDSQIHLDVANKKIESLAKFAKENIKNKNLLVLLNNMMAYNIAYTSNLKQTYLTSRFPTLLVVVPGLIKLQQEGKLKQYHQLRKEFFDIMMTDIHKKPPAYVIIDKSPVTAFVVNNQHFKGKIIYSSLLKFMRSSPRFKAFIDQCQPVKTQDKYFLILHCPSSGKQLQPSAPLMN